MPRTLCVYQRSSATSGLPGCGFESPTHHRPIVKSYFFIMHSGVYFGVHLLSAKEYQTVTCCVPHRMSDLNDSRIYSRPSLSSLTASVALSFCISAGKMITGLGTLTAWSQIVADELEYVRSSVFFGHLPRDPLSDPECQRHGLLSNFVLPTWLIIIALSLSSIHTKLPRQTWIRRVMIEESTPVQVSNNREGFSRGKWGA